MASHRRFALCLTDGTDRAEAAFFSFAPPLLDPHEISLNRSWDKVLPCQD
jgi:hypothetical protein